VSNGSNVCKVASNASDVWFVESKGVGFCMVVLPIVSVGGMDPEGVTVVACKYDLFLTPNKTFTVEAIYIYYAG